MSITDELREWMRAHHILVGGLTELTDIADRIDKAHKHAIGYVDDRDPETMAENGWVKLPMDADGVPIHLGDEVYQVEGGWVYTVKSITFYPDNTTISFESKHGFGCDNAYKVRHYHAPTVEDMLWELLGDIRPDMEDEEAVPIVAAYAKRLRLADEEE